MTFSFFFFNDTATTEIYTLSLHDALPIFSFWTLQTSYISLFNWDGIFRNLGRRLYHEELLFRYDGADPAVRRRLDRKSTRLNSSHANISYAVFCLKKKKMYITALHLTR